VEQVVGAFATLTWSNNAITTDAIAEARILRAGRSIGFAQVEVRDAAGKLAAIGRVTYSVIRK